MTYREGCSSPRLPAAAGGDASTGAQLQQLLPSMSPASSLGEEEWTGELQGCVCSTNPIVESLKLEKTSKFI